MQSNNAFVAVSNTERKYNSFFLHRAPLSFYSNIKRIFKIIHLSIAKVLKEVCTVQAIISTTN